MKLSENRIRALAKKMAAEMVAAGAVEGTFAERKITEAIVKTIMADQDQELAIEIEAKKLLEQQRSLAPPGSPEYQAALIHKKIELARKKGFVL